MAPQTMFSVPTHAALPHSHRLSATNTDVYRALSRLSRASLLDTALQWLSDANLAHCAPYLTADEDDEDPQFDDAPYLAAQSVEEVREAYEELQARKGGKREVLDRILEGDWRHGISLYQLAMADTQYLKERNASQKWHALRLTRVCDREEQSNDEEQMPRLHREAFLQSLQREIGPLAKAHYYFSRDEEQSFTLLRIYLFDLPYNTQRYLVDAPNVKRAEAKSVFAVFPDATPFVYVSVAAAQGPGAAVESRSLQKLVVDAIPKALSRPQQRYTFKTTALSAKTLPALLALRGSGRSNGAAGGWSIFVEDADGKSALAFEGESRKRKLPTEALAPETTPSTDASLVETCATHEQKRLRAVAAGRFGTSAVEGDGVGIERLEVRIDDGYPKMPSGTAEVLEHMKQASRLDDDNQHGGRAAEKLTGRRPAKSLLDKTEVDNDLSIDDWRPDVRVSFQGSHVFAGIRQLVEKGVIDGEAMPGWMTGEAGVSIGVVKHGRMLAQVDAGL